MLGVGPVARDPFPASNTWVGDRRWSRASIARGSAAYAGPHTRCMRSCSHAFSNLCSWRRLCECVCVWPAFASTPMHLSSGPCTCVKAHASLFRALHLYEGGAAAGMGTLWVMGTALQVLTPPSSTHTWTPHCAYSCMFCRSSSTAGCAGQTGSGPGRGSLWCCRASHLTAW